VAKVMNEEIGSIDCQNMWELIDLPKGARLINIKWGVQEENKC